MWVNITMHLSVFSNWFDMVAMIDTECIIIDYVTGESIWALYSTWKWAIRSCKCKCLVYDRVVKQQMIRHLLKFIKPSTLTISSKFWVCQQMFICCMFCSSCTADCDILRLQVYKLVKTRWSKFWKTRTQTHYKL